MPKRSHDPFHVLRFIIRKERAEASVALSHPKDCDCKLCKRLAAEREKQVPDEA
jgi:hypothetical protein